MCQNLALTDLYVPESGLARFLMSEVPLWSHLDPQLEIQGLLEIMDTHRLQVPTLGLVIGASNRPTGVPRSQENAPPPRTTIGP